MSETSVPGGASQAAETGGSADLAMPPRRGRPRCFDREQVLEAALRMFWERGYEATSLRDLGEVTGLSGPSLYNAFGDKLGLFGAAFGAYQAGYGGYIKRAAQESPTALAALRRVLSDAPAIHTRAELPAGCLVGNGDLGSREPEVGALIAAANAENHAALLGRLRDDPETSGWGAARHAALTDYVLTVRAGLAQSARRGVTRTELEAVAAVAVAAIPSE